MQNQNGISDQATDDLTYCLETLNNILTRQIRLIDLIIHSIVNKGIKGEGENEKYTMSMGDKSQRVITLLLQSVGSSCNSLTELSLPVGMQVRDCFSITRPIIETIINICYLLAEGEPLAERAELHALQKAYTDLERESAVGNIGIKLRFTGKPEASSIEGLEEAIAEFTSKRGREKNWTDLSLDQRLEKIGKKYSSEVLTPLLTARFSIYRHASEIMHGTYFGVVYFWGLTRPEGKPASLTEAQEIMGYHLLSILFSTIISISALASAFAKEFHIPPIKRISDGFIEELYSIPLLYKGNKNLEAYHKKHLESK